jgi:hypothetical protein
MRKDSLTSRASALLLLLASVASAKHSDVHEHLEALHKRHRAHREVVARSSAETGEQGVEIRAVPETTVANASVEKRQGQCTFPSNAGLVPVTPGSQNAGWAMSPNQPCTPGNYCPYACPPGQVSVQWDPSATSYSYPKSMVRSNQMELDIVANPAPERWFVLRSERQYPEAVSRQTILPIDEHQHWSSEQRWGSGGLLPDRPPWK